jgi:hypothetical protein
VVSEIKFHLSSVWRKFNTMPPRRHVKRPVENPAMEREMNELCERLDSIETTQRISPDVGDFSDAKSE